jgi:protoheme ferro-lyase
MKTNKTEIIFDCSEILKPVEERIKQLHLEGGKYKYYHAGMINTLDAVIVALKELNISQLVIKK